MPSRPNPTPPARPLGHWCMRAISLALIGQNRSRCLSGRTKQNPVLFACELPNSPPPHKTTTMATKKATGEALVGAGVARDFGESHGGIFTGVVVSFSGGRRPTYRIHYSDGDKEAMDEGQVEYGRELYQQHVGGGKDSYVAHRELGGEMSHMNFALGLVMDLWSRRVDGGPRTRGAMDVTVESRRPVIAHECATRSSRYRTPAYGTPICTRRRSTSGGGAAFTVGGRQARPDWRENNPKKSTKGVSRVPPVR